MDSVVLMEGYPFLAMSQFWKCSHFCICIFSYSLPELKKIHNRIKLPTFSDLKKHLILNIGSNSMLSQTVWKTCELYRKENQTNLGDERVRDMFVLWLKKVFGIFTNPVLP
ncbi:hypothetical protein AMECASPLE_009853 [Ameca splendens]|uniref:Uncharacterized protein n=1 Tax=Ameca splendens TaxID=208324 RepID=A0ABV1A7I5_9TELE